MFLLKLAAYIMAYTIMARYEIPFWQRLAIGTLFIAGAHV